MHSVSKLFKLGKTLSLSVQDDAHMKNVLE